MGWGIGFALDSQGRVYCADGCKWRASKPDYDDYYPWPSARQAVLDYFEVKVKHLGEEHLPASGKYIFASNHPLGGFDGLMLIKAVSDHLGKSLFLVRDELTKIPPLAELFIPINKFGDQRR